MFPVSPAHDTTRCPRCDGLKPVDLWLPGGRAGRRHRPRRADSLRVDPEGLRRTDCPADGPTIQLRAYPEW